MHHVFQKFMITDLPASRRASTGAAVEGRQVELGHGLPTSWLVLGVGLRIGPTFGASTTPKTTTTSPDRERDPTGAVLHAATSSSSSAGFGLGADRGLRRRAAAGAGAAPARGSCRAPSRLRRSRATRSSS